MAIRLLNSYTEILYHLGRITRDRLNWNTDTSGNVGVVITRVSGRARNNGTRLIRRLNGYTCITNIIITAHDSNKNTAHDLTNASNGVGSETTVRYDPNAVLKLGTFDENTGITRPQDQPSWIILAHELIHADHANRGTRLIGEANYSYKHTDGTIRTAKTRKSELATVGIGGFNTTMDITENDIRMDQGLRLRSSY